MSNINSLFTHNQKNDFKPQSDEFLGEDGEIYCQQCKTARTVHLDSLWVRCLCKCQAEKNAELNNTLKIEEKKEKFNRLQNSSFLGQRYKNVNFSNTDLENKNFTNLYNICYNYAKEWRVALNNGLGIYLYGPSGTGKTHLTACIGNYLLDKGVSVIFTSFIDILEHIAKDFYNINNNFIRQILNVDFLIIDDLGVERLKTRGDDNIWQEKIYYIINYLYNNKKAVVFSSNYSIKELIEKRGLEQRTADRMAEMSFKRLNFNSVDNYRVKIFEENVYGSKIDSIAQE